jgi:methionine sulfoxide reductase heme-binding subunit
MTLAAALGPSPLAHGWWLASRAAGVVALALVTASTLLGLAMAARPPRPGPRAPRLVTLHEQLAVTGLVAIAVHGVALLGDPWLRPGLAGIALPGAMSYRPLFTSLGVLAGWLAALLGLSYYLRGRIGVRRWRAVHRLTAVAWALALVHTLGAGTDSGSAWLRWPLLASAALVLVLLWLRVLRGDPHARKGVPIDGRPTHAQAGARTRSRRPLPAAPRGR